jgi:predicted esterase
LIIYVPFEIYFSFREIWYDRWKEVELEEIIRKKVKIPIEEHGKSRHLIGTLLIPNTQERGILKNSLVIVSHGYSDTKETLQYIYLPLVIRGHLVLAYDARGVGESKEAGKRNEFLKRIEDYKRIINWVERNDELKDLKIYSIGFSIGAIIAFSAAFTDERVKKIVGISCISLYKKNINHARPIVLLGFLLRGIKLFPTNKENQKLSPSLVFKKSKESYSKERFQKLAQRVFLIHSENDKVIGFSNFRENISILELPEENHVVFKNGGHTMKKNEMALVGAILRFLNKN